MHCSRHLASRPAMGAPHVPVSPAHRGPTARPHHVSRHSIISQVLVVNPTTGEEVDLSEACLPKPNLSIEVDGMKIAVRANKHYVEGTTDKPTLLFVHGLAYNSYCFRYLMDDLEKDDWAAVSFDWPGHGSSEKPSPAEFPYTEEAYYAVFEKIVEKLNLKKPFFMVCQGYILSQIGLLYPVRNPDDVERIMLHSVPLDTNAKLREEF